MVGIILYPAVVLCYFYQVSQGSQRDRLVLDSRASFNVFCLFAIVQPLCLAVGGYAGMLVYCIAALLSYALLPRTERGGDAGRARRQDRKAKRA
ncbi:zinc transporter 1 [Platysternon megacephalum]|uniref:Zinc transporter 1 n=1 Tax=Platysternon megacephalum TaxID=55544 RepID=A0A4D9DSR8_9SAUR|nr:zinc transporter 1 [Platysternon megacephalum]